jgi:hypothetical protein
MYHQRARPGNLTNHSAGSVETLHRWGDNAVRGFPDITLVQDFLGSAVVTCNSRVYTDP